VLFFVGDIHGRRAALEAIFDEAEKLSATAIVQVGDFGIFWPKPISGLYDFFESRRSSVPFYFCDGNHENHTKLDSLYDAQKSDTVRVAYNCYHVRRGSLITLDAMTLLFMGGARSHVGKKDVPMILNENWWPREIPSLKEFERFEKSFKAADIIVSHDCPTSVMTQQKYYKEWSKNGVSQFFDSVLDNSSTRPDYWFFGHHHDFDSWKIDDINFYCCGKHGEAWIFDKKKCVKFGHRVVK
jgi:predicted phosphodiesterase